MKATLNAVRWSYVLGAVLTFVAKVPAEDAPFTPEQLQHIQERVVRASQARIVVRGTVVDGEERLLDNTTVKLVKTSSAAGAADVVSEEQAVFVNGTFDFDVRPYGSVSLTFMGEGYQSQTLQIGPFEPKLSDAQLLGQEPLPMFTLRNENVRVVLQPMAAGVPLREYRGLLEYRRDASGFGLSLAQAGAKQGIVTLPKIGDIGQIPDGTIYLTAERNANGDVATVQLQPPNTQSVFIYPARVVILLKSAVGGFKTINPANTKTALEDMNIAPTNGYQAELVIDEEFLRSRTSKEKSDWARYFYFACDGKYGKGRASVVRLANSNEAARVGLVLLMNEEGRQDLGTPSASSVTVLTNAVAAIEDTTPPVIALLGANPSTIECGGVYADAGATATDNQDGNITARIVVENNVDTPKAGTYQVIYRVTDTAGNAATVMRTVKVLYKFDGFLAPVGGADATGGNYAQPVRTFKLGSTIPVKFQISCGGAAVKAGVHTLQVIKYNNATTAAEPIDATPTDAATTGNQFKLAGDEWHFNLDTKATGMSTGTWQLKATLSDGSVHLVWIALK